MISIPIKFQKLYKMKSLILNVFIVLSMNTYAQTFDCTKIITSRVDKISGELTKTSSYYPFKGVYAQIQSPVGYMRVTKDGDTTTYISVSVVGSTLNVGEKGVILLLSNGVKIERPDAKIDYNSDTYGWKYSAFFALNQDEIELLKNNEKIKIFEKSQNPQITQHTHHQEFLFWKDAIQALQSFLILCYYDQLLKCFFLRYLSKILKYLLFLGHIISGRGCFLKQ